MAAYTYKSARSPAVIAGISLIVVVETFAIHMMVMDRSQVVAWLATTSSLSLLYWLWAHDRAMGRGAIHLGATNLAIKIGRGWAVDLARSNIASAIRPTFRDLPAAGTTHGADYLNLTKPAQPNVLLTLAEPASVSLSGLRIRARRIGMHLDEPDAFLTELRGS